jgi:hypothetical protein
MLYSSTSLSKKRKISINIVPLNNLLNTTELYFGQESGCELLHIICNVTINYKIELCYISEIKEKHSTYLFWKLDSEPVTLKETYVERLILFLAFFVVKYSLIHSQALIVQDGPLASIFWVS